MAKTSPVRKTIKKTAQKSSSNVKPVKGKQSKAPSNTKQGKFPRAVVQKSDSIDAQQQLKIQKALYEIADAASAVKDMQSFYRKLHNVVGKLMYAGNFFIALYDEKTDLISWEYVVDEKDQGKPIWAPIKLSESGTGTAYTIRTGKSLRSSEIHGLIQNGEIDLEDIGTIPVDGIAFSLKSNGKILGALAIQSYTEGIFYTEQDVEVLQFVAQHIATALTRARALEAERQRTAELAVINSVQEGLAKQLDIQEIYDLVGDKVREIFKADTTYIVQYDHEKKFVFSRYYVDKEKSVPPMELPFGQGMYSQVITSRKPLNLGTSQAQEKVGALSVTSPGRKQDLNESFLGVPLLAGDEVIGVVSVQSYKQHVFGENDVRLLTTLASAMSVALQNALSFKAEQERVAELAVINSIQAGLASKLELRAVIDLVGDKIRSIFNADIVFIALYDAKINVIHYPYVVGIVDGKDERFFPESKEPSGFSGEVLKTGKSAVINEQFAQRVIEVGSGTLADDGREPNIKSGIYIPVKVNNATIGIVSLQTEQREHAFSDADVRLLETIASSMGVALENARLFDETQRLFKAEQERVAELAIINSVQQGLADELNMDAIYELVGEKIHSVFPNTDTAIRIYDPKTGLHHFPFAISSNGEKVNFSPFTPDDKGIGAHVLRTGKTLVINDNMNEAIKKYQSGLLGGATKVDKSAVWVPLMIDGQARGIIELGDSFNENAFSESDVRLLETLANSMSVALQNAQSFKAEQERVAELQIINSIQQGLAAELDFQAIVDLVGDKLREVFDTPDLSISWYEEKTNLVHYLYIYEHGERLTIRPLPPRKGRQFETMVKTKQPIVMNTIAEMEKMNALATPGTDQSKSAISVPIISSDRVIGTIGIENHERENAFGESELRLLTTIAASLGTALENARLFDETQRLFKAEQERVAELAIINSVQRGLASKLEMDAIYELIGETMREIFAGREILLFTYDAATEFTHFTYVYENGERLYPKPGPISGFTKQIRDTGQPLIINENFLERAKAVGVEQAPAGVLPKSVAVVPFFINEKFNGVIGLEDTEKENSFSDSDIRLLETLANSMSVALENARLFDETQRLFKAEQERVAELQIINSIQQGLAAELDFQAIVDLVGDNLREVFKTQDMGIRWYDDKANAVHFLYEYEHGKRLNIPVQQPPAPGGTFDQFLKNNRQPIIGNTAEIVARTGIGALPGTDLSKSIISVPIVTSDRLTGSLQIENYERENAFGESELRLLTTIAASLGTALENARLFDEVQKKNVEITEALEQQTATSNVLKVIAGSPADIRPVLDAVAENAARLCEADDVQIYRVDGENLRQVTHFGPLPALQDGESLPLVPGLVTGRAVLERRAIHIEDSQTLDESEYPESAKIQHRLKHRTVISTPLLKEGNAIGAIVVRRNVVRPFTEKQISLLATFADQSAITIENVRLFTETQRLLKITEERNAELAIINSVQAALAAELNIQGIYDAVGDKIREIFHNTDLSIRIFDPASSLVHWVYAVENGERITVNPSDLTKGFSAHVFRTRQTIVINDNMAREIEKYGSFILPGTQGSKSSVYVPLIAGDQARGLIALDNYEHEHAFSDSDVRLLQTLANSMSVALENARLFDETQRLLKITEDRAAELGIINSVQSGLASKLDMQAIYELIGDKIREIFDAQVVLILTYDHEARTRKSQYIWEKGERFFIENPLPFNKLAELLIATKKTYVVNRFTEEIGTELGVIVTPGTEPMKSGIFVPLIAGAAVTGLISLQNLDREDAFSESDVRLLETLANSMSVALDNARLFDETQRLLKITEERNAELAIINSVQAALAAELNIQGIYDAVGDKIREIFRNTDMTIRVYDPKTNIVHYAYGVEKGERINVPSTELPKVGFGTHVLRTRETLVINENMRAEMEKFGSQNLPGTDYVKSAVFVPLVVGDQARGLINVNDSEREHAYNESDVRLLQTLANSMSVALENARLFDETQRLLKITEERAEELAIINSVQEGLAAKLDIQAIYDLVGNKICEIFNLQTCFIMIYDKAKETEFYPFLVEDGVRQIQEPIPHDNNGFGPLAMRTRQPIMINEKMIERSAEVGSYIIGGGSAPQSAIYVPLLIGAEAKGVISVQNTQKEFAFTDSDLRLLTTLASSMSVALESARLFAETEQRAAELVIINQVQLGLASKLDVSAIYELIGEQLRNMFDSQAISIISFDHQKNTRHFQFILEKGHRLELPDAPIPPMAQYIIQTKQPLIVNKNFTESLAAIGITTRTLPGTEPTKSLLRVPIIAGGEVRGMIGLDNIDRENAFNETDVRLLTTLANGMSVALENARLFKEAQEARAAADKANATKSTFLSNMSHELRTPLNAIIGFSRIVRRKAEGVLPEKQTENLDKILTSAEHLLGLINTVLDIAKIEAGRMDVHPAEFDITATAEQCLTLASALLKPNVTLKKNLDADIPLMFSDQEKIRQIVLNLLSNAAKFTHEGSITLALEKHDQQIQIHVKDSGIGISDEALGRVFEEFQQADSTTTRKYGGTGLGLAISRNLARLLGGDLTATSQLGQGSTFTLSVPLQYQLRSASHPNSAADSAQLAN